jgi:hypothetical protein
MSKNDRGAGRKENTDVKEYSDFWMIWGSCVDKDRSIGDIFKEWGIDPKIKENPNRKKIWERMLQEKYITKVKKLSKTDPCKSLKTGFLVHGNIEWVEKGLSDNKDFQANHDLLMKVFNENKATIFDLDKLKVLFKNNYEILRDNGKFLYVLPLFVPSMLSGINYLSKTKKGKLNIRLALKLTSWPVQDLDIEKYFQLVENEVKKNKRDVPTSIFEKIYRGFKP